MDRECPKQYRVTSPPPYDAPTGHSPRRDPASKSLWQTPQERTPEPGPNADGATERDSGGVLFYVSPSVHLRLKRRALDAEMSLQDLCTTAVVQRLDRPLNK